MWALLSTRMRTWLLLSVLLPLLAAAVRFLARRIERKQGPSRLTKALHTAGNLGRRGGRTADVDAGAAR